MFFLFYSVVKLFKYFCTIIVINILFPFYVNKSIYLSFFFIELVKFPIEKAHRGGESCTFFSKIYI